MKEGVQKSEQGYEAELLWKSDARPHPSNKWQVFQRFNNTLAKMRKDPDLHRKANLIIRTYEDKGYISKLAGDHNGEAEWFLPVFPVRNSKKVRLVFDAAAIFHGTSLNSLLLKGPDLNEPLWNILLRFREYPVAFCADISEMFHRVKVVKEDQRFQRFWWTDENGAPTTYQMNVLTFGAACSPCISQFVKNANADKF